MSIDSHGKIIPQTPTDQLAACMEQLSHRDDVKHIIVVFACEALNEKGNKQYSVEMFGSCEDYWQAYGILKHAVENI